MTNKDAKPLFYRGDLDHKVVRADNGALLNEDYLRFIRDGSWGEVVCSEVRPGIHCLTGLGFANHTFIESENGYILFDTGTNYGSGVEMLKFKEQFSDKPIVAIIYSHHHYTQGAQAVLDAYPERNIPVYAHPLLEENLLCFKAEMGPAQLRRAQAQTGLYLPKEGPDASACYGFCTPQFEDSKLNGIGHVNVDYEVADGEEIVIDGVRTVFYHTSSDATDSLIVYFPDYDMIAHNAAIMPMVAPLYTLRGEKYRIPPDLIAGIDRVRAIAPEILIGCHGFPVVGKDKVYQLATAHRDAYAFLYQQTLRGINRGLDPDQLVKEIQLAPGLQAFPELFPAYIDTEYAVRGIYRGLVGWWANDPAEIHPPEPKEYHSVLLRGFGGTGNMLAAASEALEEKKYNLCAKLLTTVLTVDPDHEDARQMKSTALKKMAYATPTGIQTRNFLLTDALHLSGEIDKNKPPQSGFMGSPNPDMVLKSTPGTYIKLLENHIDPMALPAEEIKVRFVFTDIDMSFGLLLRWGAGEYLPYGPNFPDVNIEMPRTLWANIVVKSQTLDSALAGGEATISGDSRLIDPVKKAFKEFWGG